MGELGVERRVAFKWMVSEQNRRVYAGVKLTEVGDCGWAVVKTVMNCWVPQNSRNFFIT